MEGASNAHCLPKKRRAKQASLGNAREIILHCAQRSRYQLCPWGEFLLPKKWDSVTVMTFLYLILNTTMRNKKQIHGTVLTYYFKRTALSNYFAQLHNLFMCLDTNHPSKANTGYPQPPASLKTSLSQFFWLYHSTLAVPTLEKNPIAF